MAHSKEELEGMTKEELEDMARDKGMSGVSEMSKEDLMNAMMKEDGDMDKEDMGDMDKGEY